MKYLKIKNTGLLDTKALTLIGASTKGGDSTKIGQFGSGNKYALAYLLRNKFEILIFSGKKEIKLTKTWKTFRGHRFNIIHVNGVQTSITTEMGKDWELWQAIREIYCNALDEGESLFEVVDYPEPKAKETHFYISMNRKLKAVVDNFDNYFSHRKKVLFECPDGQILEKTGKAVNIYRKGIKCSVYNTNSMFDYNLQSIGINENRVIQWDWESHEGIWNLIFQCTNKEVILKLLTAEDRHKFEHTLSSSCDLNTHKASDEFKEVVTSLQLAPEGHAGLLAADEQGKFSIIPDKVYKEIKPMLKNENLGKKFRYFRQGAYQEVEANEQQNSIIEQALGFLKDVGFHIPYVVQVGIFTDKEVLGCAYHDGEVIILSEIGLEKGVKDVINTLIEEYIHLKYDCDDETRAFQTAIIGELVTYMEGKTTEVL